MYKEMNTSSVERSDEVQSSEEESNENVVNSGRNDPELVFVNNVTGGDVIEYFDWFIIELTEDDENVSLEFLIVSLLL